MADFNWSTESPSTVTTDGVADFSWYGNNLLSLKLRTESVWEMYPLKRWTGTDWLQVSKDSAKVWDGQNWAEAF